MASAAKSLQLCVRRCCASARPTSASSSTTTARTPLGLAATAIRIRGVANTPILRYAAGDEGSSSGSAQPLAEWEREMMDKEAAAERIMNITESLRATLSPEERAKIEPVSSQQNEKEFKYLSDMRRDLAFNRRNIRAKRDSFWNEEEPEPEMVTDEVGEDDLQGEDITSMGHAKLDEHRERRLYARLLAWELPLLSRLAKPFEPPSADMPLRFRYTSYMGEFHPAEKKVVVEFCPADFDMTPMQQDKLKKLVGTRYNPETEIIRMSCEMYEHQAQNKRYLGDLVEKLLAEAKDPKDTFEDIPLDTRHHTFKYKPKFPKEWRMSDERRQELQELRARSFLVDQQKIAEGTLIDGAQRIQAALAAPPPEASAEKVAALVRLRPGSARQSLRR